MPLGPFDRRTKSSRCTPCITSHSKCSGSNPCTRCFKRSIECTFPASSPPGDKAAILLHRGKLFTAETFTTSSTPHPSAPLPDVTVTYLYYFDTFMRRNSFTGQDPVFLEDVQSLMKGPARVFRETRQHLPNAMLALGAMQAYSHQSSRESLHFALESYTRSIADLREAVSDTSSTHRESILWTTLFLGLFELMQDASGQKWLQHMIFGTSQALVASGPSSCISGPMRSFFNQARVFEVCRSIIFNESSFLASAEWIGIAENDVSNKINEAPCSPLSDILNLIVLCSALRARTSRLISYLESGSATDTSFIQASNVAFDGFCLSEALESWKTNELSEQVDRQEILLATTFYAATRIYLSGNYDYELRYWHQMSIAVPVLSAHQITAHFDMIVQTTKEALKTSQLSPLLFLFPLRIAGARAKRQEQRRIVTELLLDVRKQFVVADAMLDELKRRWDLIPAEV